MIRYLGASQGDAWQTGVSAIRWYQCQSCLKQLSQVIMAKEVEPLTPVPDPEKAVRPIKAPLCCQHETTWLGRESRSIGKESISFDEWKCSFCTRTRRVPHEEEPTDGETDEY